MTDPHRLGTVFQRAGTRSRAGQLPLEDAAASDGIYAPTLGHHQGSISLVTTTVAAGDARSPSTAVATGFTGVYLGCYATGNGNEASERARFLDFEYAPTIE